MVSLGGLLLGIINIGIVVVILVLVGAIAVWFLSLMQWPVPWNVQRLYLAVVALIALYMLVALILGMPTMHIVGYLHRAGLASGLAFAVALPGIVLLRD